MPRKLRKRGGTAAGGSSAGLGPTLSRRERGRKRCGGAEERRVLGTVVGKGCLKRPGTGASASASGGGSGVASTKKVSFVLEHRVWIFPRDVAKTRGKWNGGLTRPRAQAGRGGRRRTRARAGADSAGEAGGDAPVRRSRRNVVNLGDGDGVERVAGAVSQSNSAHAEGEDDVGVVSDKKRKRKTGDNDEDLKLSAQVRVSHRSTRSSGRLATADSVSFPVVAKKRGRKTARDITCVEVQPAQVQDLGGSQRKSGLVTIGEGSPTVVESVEQKEDPAVHSAAKVEIFGRITRSRSVAAAVILPFVPSVAATVMLPIFVEDNRRMTEDVHSDGHQPAVLEVPTNEAPVSKALTNIAVLVNSSVVEETHFGKKLEKKKQHNRPATCSRSHQQLGSSVEEESQENVVAPCEGPPLRRSRRNHSEAKELLSNNNATSESNNCSRAPELANEFKIARIAKCNTAMDDVEYGGAKTDEHVELRKRNPKNGRVKVATNGGELPFSDSSGKTSAIEMQQKVKPVRRVRTNTVDPNLNAGDGVKKVAKAVSQNNSSKTEDIVTSPVEKNRRSKAGYVKQQTCVEVLRSNLLRLKNSKF